MALRRLRTVLVSSVLLVAGCLGRTVPILPPGVDGADVAAVTCAGENCPTDGVTVHVHGSAMAGAMVVVLDTTRSFADGRPFQATAFAAAEHMIGDAGTSTPPGAYDVWLEPQPDPAGGSVVAHHGDRLEVFQLVRQPDNSFEQSMARTIDVP